MWQLVTGFAPDTPPQSSISGFVRPDGGRQQFWTYGGLVQAKIPETDFHDPALTQLIAWCMGESKSWQGKKIATATCGIESGETRALRMELGADFFHP